MVAGEAPLQVARHSAAESVEQLEIVECERFFVDRKRVLQRAEQADLLFRLVPLELQQYVAEIREAFSSQGERG